MTLFEMIGFLLLIAIGYACGKIGVRLFGPWGGFAFIPGFLLIPSIAMAHARYRKWLYKGDRHMPDCSCGSNAFTYEKVGSEYHLLCKECRVRYERTPDTVFVYHGNEKIIFRRLVKHKGWV